MRKTKRIVWLAAAALAAVLAAVAGCKHDDEDDWTPVTIRGTMLEKYAGQRTDVTIPDGVTGIGSRAFSDSDVTAVVIPSGVTSIDANAFVDSKVTSVSYLGTLGKWNELVGGGLPDNIKVSCFIIDENGLLTGYEGDETEVVIPAGFVKGIADKDIGDGVFSGRDITVVTIPGSVRRVGTHTFAGCTALVDVRIEAGVADIGDGAFAGCTRLESATIPAGVRRLGGGIFNGCTGLTGLSVHESVTEIAPGALAGTEILEAITYTGRKAQWEKLVADKERDFAGKRVYCQDGEDWWYGPERDTTTPGDDTGDEGDHKHTLIYISDGESGHHQACECGERSETEAHVYDDDSDAECNKCGYVRENSGNSECDHNLIVAHNESGHYQKCTECDYQSASVNYAWGEYKDNLNGTHSRSCTAEGCGYTETQAHSLGECESDGEGGHKKTCTARCGYSEPVPHEWSTTYTTDANKHYKTCMISGCIAHDEEGAHDYTGVPYKDDDNGGHYQNCKVCKHQSDSVDHNKYKYEKIDSGNHRVTCEDCDYSIDEEHKYDDDTDAKCDKCGNERVVKPLLGSLPIEGGTLTIDAEGKVTGYTHDYAQSSEVKVDIPAGVTGIGNDAFKGTDLKDVTFPDTVTSIGSGAFQDCGCLTVVVIPDEVTSIGASAFAGCGSLTSVTIPTGITSIEDYTFFGCGRLASVTIPGNVERIGTAAFANCGSLQTVVISEGVKHIGDGAFQGCGSLTKVEIPMSMESIGNSAFYGCSSLTEIEIPASVKTIGEEAFSLSGVKNVTFTGTKEAWDALVGSENIGLPDDVEITFKGDAVSYVMQGTTLVAYSGNEAVVTIPNGVTAVGEGAFKGCTALTGVTIPDSVTTIGDNAFQNCAHLTSVSIPAGVKRIGINAFSYCTSLAGVTFPDGLETIGEYAFEYCTSLASLSIPASVKSIDTGAFSNGGGCFLL